MRIARYRTADARTRGRTAALSEDEFRHVIGHFATGVTVITARNADDHPVGTTASAVSSLCASPPMLLACLNKRSQTGAIVAATGTFAVNVLAEDQAHLAARFAAKAPDKFADVDHTVGPAGQPLLDGALAHLECAVTESVVGGTHTVFLAAVRSARAFDGRPLAYYRGTFGRLAGHSAAG